MSESPPLIFEWMGDGFKPAGQHWAKQADKHFTIGSRYALVEYQGRSQASHNFYFASLHNAWMNLPENLVEQFPTETHLRKYALIKTGFHDSHSLVCSSNAEALRVASYIRPLDEFGVVIVKGQTVSHYTAKSQSMRAMGKEDFNKSKEAVLDLIASMVGITRKELDAQQKDGPSEADYMSVG